MQNIATDMDWTNRAPISFEADAVRDGLASLPERTTVLFTAHSLPERVLGHSTGQPGEGQRHLAARGGAAGPLNVSVGSLTCTRLEPQPAMALRATEGAGDALSR